MTSYIFETNIPDREFRRLRLVEEAHDPRTISLLNSLHIKPEWQCLEIGAGAGSILRWLGEKVGTNGRVVGVDRQASYLHQFSSPPYDIHENEFLEAGIEGPFDLIHSRYVLIHNIDHQAILNRIFHLLKPGGFLVLEEPDFTSSHLFDRNLDESHVRVNAAICQMFLDLGLDPAYGLHLPLHVQSCGLHVQETHSDLHLCPGQSPLATVMGESALALTPRYCETGKCTEQDIQHYVANTKTLDTWAIYHSTVSVIARRPDLS